MEIDPNKAAMLIKENKAVVIDVREIDEYSYGHLPGSINFPMSRFSREILNIVDKNNKTLVICRSGCRSLECVKEIKNLGYKDAYSISGGLKELNNFLDEKVNIK